MVIRLRKRANFSTLVLKSATMCNNIGICSRDEGGRVDGRGPLWSSVAENKKTKRVRRTEIRSVRRYLQDREAFMDELLRRIRVARGEVAADLVLHNANLVNVC